MLWPHTLAELLGNVQEPGKPSLPGDAGCDSKEFLLRFVGRIALDLAQGGGARVPGVAATFGNFGHVGGDVFLEQQPQPALANYALVVAGGNEKKEADGTTHLDFVGS